MTTPSSPTPDNGKTIAILSYISWIGWIIALVMHNGNKTKLGSYHLRQTLGLYIVGIVFAIAMSILGGIAAATGIRILVMLIGVLYMVGGLGLFVLWILGLLAAVKGEEKPMPVVGEKIQSALKGVFAS